MEAEVLFNRYNASIAVPIIRVYQPTDGSLRLMKDK